MRVVVVCHSLRSDWNHGNAHFLRGLVTELVDLGHQVRVFEPADGWSARNLAADAGPESLDAFRVSYPLIDVSLIEDDEAERVTDGADLVLVHEWTEPRLIERIGRLRARGGRFVLLFHDTHHRSVSRPEDLRALDLSAYDGVLAFGAVIAERYRAEGWGSRVRVWHEAADSRVFHPRPAPPARRDVAWVGNWGDDERTAELEEFLLAPARQLRVRGTAYGVRYPEEGQRAMEAAGLEYRGWLPNFRVPEVYAAHRVTIHVPRRPYVRQLPGIPTIRVFEALACGIPLVCAPWHDAEGLFTAGRDYLVARDTAAMTRHLRALLADGEYAGAIASHGRSTVLARHTCRHRAEELLAICRELAAPAHSEIA